MSAQAIGIRAGAILRLAVLGAAFCAGLAAAAEASDDFQYWSRFTLKTWEEDRWSLSTYGDVRFMDDAGETRLYLISEKLGYRWLENLDLGANYTYLESKAALAPGRKEEFKFQHRAELEVNPHWTVADGVRITNRNRIEFRWIEDRGSDNARFRHRWGLEIPAEGLPPIPGLPIRSFYFDNEFFYDFHAGEFNENRATPLGVKFKLGDNAGLSVFYMIQARKGASDWSSNQILGTHLTLSF